MILKKKNYKFTTITKTKKKVPRQLTQKKGLKTSKTRQKQEKALNKQEPTKY